MKYGLLFLLFVSFLVNGFADCNCLRFSPCPKTYVTLDQIDLHQEGIFVQVGDFVLQTESLKSDSQGLFFTNSRDGCGPSQWRCQRRLSNGAICETCNWDWNYSCSYCKKDKK